MWPLHFHKKSKLPVHVLDNFIYFENYVASSDSTLETPDTVERRKLAIVQEVLYGQDKVKQRALHMYYKEQ